MKKVYEKPALYIERFTLAQTIASGCGENLDLSMATHSSKKTCGWEVAPGLILFMSFDFCNLPTEYFEGVVCYNAPAGGYNVFAS